MQKNQKFFFVILMAALISNFITVKIKAEGCGAADKLDKLVFTWGPNIESGLSVDHFSLKGYTGLWYEFYGAYYRYAGIYSMIFPEPHNHIREIEDNIRNHLLLEELWMQKGFIATLADSNVTNLIDPDSEEINAALSRRDVLIVGTDRNRVIEELLNKIPEEIRFRRTRAFYFEGGSHRLFVIASHTDEEALRLKKLVDKTIEFTRKYTLYKGIAGYSTNYFSLSSLDRNPLEIIAKALNLRCSWILLDGYNDWMTSRLTKEWLSRIKFDFIFESGQHGDRNVMHGMEEYPPVQDNTLDDCYEWTKKRGGYIFGVLDPDLDKKYNFDGYLIRKGGQNIQDKIDQFGKPFITHYGSQPSDIPPMMVLFLEKEAALNPQNIFRAILDEKAVALFSDGQMIGPRQFIEFLWILTLDRVYLDNEFAERADIAAKVQGEELLVTVRNKGPETLTANLLFDVPGELTIGDNVSRMPISLNAWGQRTIRFSLSYTNEAAGRINPIAVTLDWGCNKWSTVAYLEIPSPIEIYPLMLVDEEKFLFPITLWNSSKKSEVEVKVQVFAKNNPTPVLLKMLSVDAPYGQETTFEKELSLKQGDYMVKASVPGHYTEGKISVRKSSGTATVRKEDLNHDGIPEIIMENSQIRATILLTGGRVIDYILKSRNENLLFTLWPEKPPLHNKPGGMRTFYPYGGLEVFIGQPTIKTHTVFKYEILKSSGPYVSVKLWANIHGNIVEKLITLRGDSTVLEVKYAFRNMHESLNIIGINPLIQIGPSDGMEDVYYFPVGDKIEERRPRLEGYYGTNFDVTQGWSAGENADMNISLVVAYPVDATLFMHHWSNHPNNTPTPYFYKELQPWLRINHGTTTYFSFYLFGYDGSWKDAVQDLNDLGLITTVR